MRIAIGGDHRATGLLRELAAYLTGKGHEVDPIGVCDEGSCDYPDMVGPVAETVAAGSADLGIVACGSGNGVAIVANKVPGVRAVIGFDVEAAAMGRAHNDANVLSLSADRLGGNFAPVVDAFLETDFEGGRHERRVAKIRAIEERTADRMAK